MMVGHPREVDGGMKDLDGGMKDLRTTEIRTDGTRGLTGCGRERKKSQNGSDFWLRSQGG